MILREFNSSDSEALLKLLNNPAVSKYLSSRIPYPYTQVDADWWIAVGSKQGFVRAIVDDEKLLGCIGVESGEFEESRTGEIGYWIGEQYWGRGLATSAVNEVTNRTFQATSLVRLFAPVFSPNVASMRVLEKCKYKLEGIFEKACFKDGKFHDKHIYARVNS